MRDLIEFIVRSLVDKPDQVRVNERLSNHHKIILQLTVAKEDMGRIIGKRGKVIGAIRSAVMASASKKNLRIRLEVTDSSSSI